MQTTKRCQHAYEFVREKMPSIVPWAAVTMLGAGYHRRSGRISRYYVHGRGISMHPIAKLNPPIARMPESAARCAHHIA